MDSVSSLFLFWLKKSVSVLIMPPLLPFFMIFIGLVLIWRHRRGGFVLIWAGFIAGVLAITP
ncbi:MAG: YdcF family protein, partial [Azoarcus sp.]|nr:YdcF family protein [Azoarcus sp.]